MCLLSALLVVALSQELRDSQYSWEEVPSQIPHLETLRTVLEPSDRLCSWTPVIARRRDLRAALWQDLVQSEATVGCSVNLQSDLQSLSTEVQLRPQQYNTFRISIISQDFDFVCDETVPWLHYDGSSWAPATPPSGSGCHHYVFIKGTKPSGCVSSTLLVFFPSGCASFTLLVFFLSSIAPWGRAMSDVSMVWFQVHSGAELQRLLESWRHR